MSIQAVPAFRLEQRRSINGTFPGPKSVELNTRRAAVVAKGVASSVPVYVADADGGIIRDVDGNSFIDLGSGIAVTSVGASDPAVVDAVKDQVEHFTHTCFMVTPYEGYIALAEKLHEVTPGDHEKRTVLFNSGAEAVENAVKIARSATGRDAVVAFDHAYHGRTNLTMGLTAKAMPYKTGFGPFASEIYRMPMSYPYREENPEITGAEAADRVILAIEKQIGADQTAAILIEPIQGEGGFIVPAEGFLPRLAEWAKANGVVFIADEVQSGFCRTGEWFAVQHEGVVPDLLTMAKGIAGGMPLSAVTGRAELLDAVHPGGLGGTYGGNPVACAAALADKHHGNAGPGGQSPPHRGGLHATPARAGGRNRCDWRGARPRGHAGAGVREAGHQDARCRHHQGCCRSLPGRGRHHPDLRDLRQRGAPAAAAGYRRGPAGRCPGRPGSSRPLTGLSRQPGRGRIPHGVRPAGPAR
jgi:4-aminobutyrate aminotransferase/(S)-3-amino-2-methylpropionate transaminase